MLSVLASYFFSTAKAVEGRPNEFEDVVLARAIDEATAARGDAFPRAVFLPGIVRLYHDQERFAEYSCCQYHGGSISEPAPLRVFGDAPENAHPLFTAETAMMAGEGDVADRVIYMGVTFKRRVKAGDIEISKGDHKSRVVARLDTGGLVIPAPGNKDLTLKPKLDKWKLARIGREA